MKEAFFVLKVFVVTFVLVVFMQIRVGELTIEERASLLIQDSWITGYVQEVGLGLNRMISDSTGSIGQKFSGIFKGRTGQSRLEKFIPKRNLPESQKPARVSESISKTETLQEEY